MVMKCGVLHVRLMCARGVCWWTHGAEQRGGGQLLAALAAAAAAADGMLLRTHVVGALGASLWTAARPHLRCSALPAYMHGCDALQRGAGRHHAL